MTLFQSSHQPHQALPAANRSIAARAPGRPGRKWAAVADRSQKVPKVRVVGTLSLGRAHD